jgi:hypothetical protein
MGSGAAGMGLLGQHLLNPTANLMPKTSQVVLGVPCQQKSSKLGGVRPCPSYKPFCFTASLTMGKSSASAPAQAQPCNFPGVYVVCHMVYLFLVEIVACITLRIKIHLPEDHDLFVIAVRFLVKFN